MDLGLNIAGIHIILKGADLLKRLSYAEAKLIKPFLDKDISKNKKKAFIFDIKTITNKYSPKRYKISPALVEKFKSLLLYNYENNF